MKNMFTIWYFYAFTANKWEQIFWIISYISILQVPENAKIQKTNILKKFIKRQKTNIWKKVVFLALQVPGTAKNERLPRHCGVQAWRWDLLSGKPKFGDSNQNWDDWIQFWDDTCVGEICRIKCLGQDKWLGFTVPGLRTKSP